MCIFCCSLENMYKELTNDIAGFRNPGHGNLTGWAKQGNHSNAGSEPDSCQMLV